MKAKVIKNEAEYREALAYMDTLMDAEPGSPQEEDLELFSVLLEEYEKQHFPIGLPDAVEAINFRMEQQGLTRRDLEPYIGSQSRVSEVLNRKRPLSLAMIRALHAGLGIPAEVLLQEAGKELADQHYDSRDYPFTEMYNSGYFPSFQGSLAEAKQYSEELLVGLFSGLGLPSVQRVYCRNSDRGVNENALASWQARVLNLASGHDFQPFFREKLTSEFLRELVKTSAFSTGPLLARELLARRGISLVTLPHLRQTYLDGACFNSPSGHPVIGMTLRHDRLDNFWFTLVHELAHIFLHLSSCGCAFFDDTEQGVRHSSDRQEIEANQLASDLLIPSEAWDPAAKGLLNTGREANVVAFADELGISPAIVAGRIRWESGDYTRFPSLVGSRTVRKLFQSED